MIVHLISTLALAAISVLFAWAVFRTLKRPMPRALIPALAAISAIAYGIYSEYTWESRTLAQMPESIEVVHRFQGASVFSPWAYVVPRTDRLSVVDVQASRRHPALPQMIMIDLLFLQRFNPVIRARQLIDCQEFRRADLKAEQAFDEQGLPVDVIWDPLGQDHQLIDVVCSETAVT